MSLFEQLMGDNQHKRHFHNNSKEAQIEITDQEEELDIFVDTVGESDDLDLDFDPLIE